VDSRAQTPLSARVVTDDFRHLTTVVITSKAPRTRVKALARRIQVLEAPPDADDRVDLRWLMARLGAEEVTSLLVEGGGEVHARCLFGGLAHCVAFFYAPLVLGGRDARKAVAGIGARNTDEILHLERVRWRRVGPDLLLMADVPPRPPAQ
jgi:diaminohydroxyphosphoribosylaminopyrimidine deaminase/5-amino-6-(5-phosphoribosylamino)uracil reductase